MLHCNLILLRFTFCPFTIDSLYDSLENVKTMDSSSVGSPMRDHGSDVEMMQSYENTKQTTRWELNQRVFAKDNLGNKHYYPASIVQIKEQGKGEWRYKVHYLGWNSRWDQWLSDEKLMKDNDHNRKFLEDSKLLYSAENTATDANSATVDTKNKRKREDDRPVKKRRGGNNTLNLKNIYEDFCELPLTLKTVLMDEMHIITRAHPYDCSAHNTSQTKTPLRKVHQLPAPVTIHQVLKHFCKKRIQQLSSTEAASAEKDKDGTSSKRSAVVEPAITPDDVQEFIQGLASLFDEALPKFLLYPQERPQFEALMRQPDMEDKPLTEIFGCEYLLRLYVRLPVLMQSENASNVKIVGPLLAELLVLMQKNRQACFKGVYREPTQEEWLQSEYRGDLATRVSMQN